MSFPVIVGLCMTLVVTVIGYKIGFYFGTQPYESEWIRVDATGDTVTPTTVFVCENCHNKRMHNTLYCGCCGRQMRYGKHFNDEELLKLR